MHWGIQLRVGASGQSVHALVAKTKVQEQTHGGAQGLDLELAHHRSQHTPTWPESVTGPGPGTGEGECKVSWYRAEV